MLLLCEIDVLSIEVAKNLLMMGFYSSFQSERHIAPFVILFITFSYHADRNLGRDSSDVLRRSEAAVFPRYDLRRHDRLAEEMVLAQ